MRSSVLTRIVTAGAVASALALATPAILVSPASADPAVTFTPNPATPGATVTVSVDGWAACNNNGELAPSYITLINPDGDDVDGSFPGGTPVGTLVLPADIAPGDYNVQVQCSFSVGNSTYYPENNLTIDAAAPTTTTTESVTPSSVVATTSTASAVAPSAVTASPAFTG